MTDLTYPERTGKCIGKLMCLGDYFEVLSESEFLPDEYRAEMKKEAEGIKKFLEEVA